MNIVFMGTPEFSATILKNILTSDHKVVGVVTQPDRPAGRGHKLKSPPVKDLALEHGLPVLQTENLKDPTFLQDLKALNADLFVVVAFSILPKEALAIPPKGSVNLHGSLLPKYRGAAPIQWAIANGDSETGITIFCLDEKMDHGPVLIKSTLPILSTDNAATLFEKMAELGKVEMLKALSILAQDSFDTLPQDHGLATKAPKLKKEDGLIDWSKTSIEIFNRIRGFYPWPSCYSTFQGKTMKITKAQLSNFNSENEAQLGEMIFENSKQLFVKTGDGFLEILELQLQGKKPMTPEQCYCGLQNRDDLILT